ncbi:hypothetical protein [Pseudarthrobacter sp. Y6]|uniref:hypothetical protein n=1 Tax=Pseudarthrobacter sp. Y6 TaxID=3418422 RepID=UPI003CE7392B
MTLQLVDTMHEHLTEANNRWPRDGWTTAEGRAGILEKRLARAVGPREVEFSISSVTEEDASGVHFAATLFTADLVISGALHATNEQIAPRDLTGDVVIVPRSALRSLTLHQVEYFGNDNEATEDHVSFTATYEGMAPVVVGPPSSGSRRGATSRLFDALQADLAQV